MFFRSWYSVPRGWSQVGEERVTAGQSHKACEQSVVSYLRGLLPSFSLYFLGLLAVRVWLQSAVYDRYLSTDAGFITVASNVIRVVFIAILLAVAVRQGFPERRLSALAVVSVVSMTAASVLFLFELETGITWLMWPACLLAGFGVIWGGGMWMRFYERLRPGESLFCLFLSLAGSCVIGFFLGLIPENVTHLVGILMPVTSLFAYQRALSALDERDGKMADAQTCAPSSCYDKEPRSTFVRLVVGVALFNLALGLARGFPHGDAIPLPIAYQFAHQFGTCLLFLLVVWWALVKGRGVRFSTLWIISISFIIVGVLLLSFADPNLMASGATFISIANTFTLGVLWYCSYYIGRHLSIPAYAVLGIAWIAHLLPREIGRSAIWLIGPSDHLTVVVMVAMVVLIAVSIGFVMNDSIPTLRPFFAELNGMRAPVASSEEAFVPVGVSDSISSALETTTREDTDGQEAALSAEGLPRMEACKDEGTGALHAAGLSADMRVPAPVKTGGDKTPYDAAATLKVPLSAESKDDRAFALLRERHFLTDREVEVARLMAQGRSKAAIAGKLFLSENTVRTHARNLYAKLDVHNRQELLDAIESACEACAEDEPPTA